MPGAVNATKIPYESCRLDGVQDGTSPVETSREPACWAGRHMQSHEATPRECGLVHVSASVFVLSYWCVSGIWPLVVTTSCVPSLEFGSLVVTSLDVSAHLVSLVVVFAL